jgi:ABC-type transport system involved in multi-copper enzyme maturation permease subunit
MMRVLAAEFMKLKRSRMLLWTALVPLSVAVLEPAMFSALTRPDVQSKISAGGGVFAKAVAAGLYQGTWKNFLSFLPQAISGSWGLLTFALIASYLFGREFKEGTMKTVLTLPLPRGYTVVAKMIVLAVWMAALTLFAIVLQMVAAALVHPTGFAWSYVWRTLADGLLVSLLIYLTLPVTALFAMRGKGYLQPMLFTLAAMLIGNGIATTSVSRWFPWNMPIHLVGASWLPISPSPLVAGSWLVTIAVFIAGVAALVWQIDHADNTQ